ncbi:MAG: Ig-like domain-containing protein, partial [Lachnospiraceae bacterium]|nr:Ig-like domain-containing protein [Lachnospiraceae bacterium]
MKWKKWCVGLAAAALLCGITIPAAADIAAEQNTEMDLPADEALEEKDEADKLSEGDFSTTIAYFVAVSPETPGTMYYKGQTEILTATVTSSENPDQPISDVSVTWVSSNTSVATVNENGEVTAVNDGTSEISVSAITVDGTTYQVSESAEEESTEDEDADTVTVETSGCCEVIVNLYTGFYETTENNKTVYYYYSNGVLMTNTVQNGKAFEGKTAWWYVDENGKASNTYTGFATNQNGVWYLESGKVTFCKNSVIQDKTGAIGTKGTWWYVVGSKVQTGFTGLADYANENGWWYIENGKVTFTKNTVAKNKNGWWYVTGGKVQFG